MTIGTTCLLINFGVGIGENLCSLNQDVFDWSVLIVGSYSFHSIKCVHSTNNSAKDGVLPVEVLTGAVRYKTKRDT